MKKLFMKFSVSFLILTFFVGSFSGINSYAEIANDPLDGIPNLRGDLTFNIAENAFLRGFVLVKAAGGMDAKLALSVDGEAAPNTGTVLSMLAKIVVEGSGIQPSQGYENTVYLNDQWVYTFMKDLENYEAVEIEVPTNLLTSGTNKITVNSGSVSSNYGPNYDDFSIRNVRMILYDGTELTDPAVPVNRTIGLGDGYPPNPATAKLFHDSMVNIPLAEANTLLYDFDTTKLADGEHTLELKDKYNGQFYNIMLHIDNTAPTIKIESPQAGQIYKGMVPVTIHADDASSGIDSLEIFLDGEPIEADFVIRVSDLSPGEHVLKVKAFDMAGNVSEEEAVFTTVEENPLKPQDASPADHSANVSTEPTLHVVVKDPTDDALDVKFLKAYRYDFTDGKPHRAYSNAVDREPPLELIPSGEIKFGAGEYEAVATADDRYMTNDSIEQFPYQRFEFVIKEDLQLAESVEVVWEGHSLPDRRVTLYAWNYLAEEWQPLASDISGLEDFTLRGELSTEAMIRANVANIMVQDLIPTPDEYDFSFVWMTDTQNLAKEFPRIYNSMTEWIASNAKEQKIEYVIHTGDIVDSSERPQQWINADISMKILEEAGIPYGVLAGNHDVQPNTSKPIDYTQYGKWFGRDRFKNLPHYGGDNENNRDHYDLISVNGHDFIIVYFGYEPEQSSLDWAKGVLERYSDRNAIIANHLYIDPKGRYSGQGQKIFDQIVVPYDNVFLVLNGHHLGLTRNKVVIGDRIVHEVVTNYQAEPEGGMGYMRLMKFDPENGLLHMNTYSPYLDDYNWFNERDEEFTLSVQLLPIQKKVSTDYIGIHVKTTEIIGEQKQVPSNSKAETVWSNLKNDSGYYWYVRLEDEFGGMTESDIWGFKTEKSSVPGNLILATLILAILILAIFLSKKVMRMKNHR